MPTNPWEVRPADLQQQDVRRRGVLFVVRVLGPDEKLVAGEFLGPVAVLARVARRPEVLHRRGNGRVVGLEGDGIELAQAVDLGLDEPRRAGPDVALHAGHPGVGRVEVRRVLGLHHRVARLPAELSGVHVLDGLVGGRPHDREIEEGQEEHEDHRPPQKRAPEVDGRVVGRQLAFFPELAAPQQRAERHQDQAQDEDGRKDEEEDDAVVGVNGAAARDQVGPEDEQRDGGTGREDGAGDRRRVLGEEDGHARPPALRNSTHRSVSPFGACGSPAGSAPSASRRRSSSRGCSSSISRSVSIPVSQAMFIGYVSGLKIT